MTHALTPEDVARELVISVRTAQQWMLEIPGAFRIGKLWRVGRPEHDREGAHSLARASEGRPARRQVPAAAL